MYDSVRVHMARGREYLEKMPTKYKEYYDGRMREDWHLSMGYEYEGRFDSALTWHKVYSKYLAKSVIVKSQEKIDRIDIEKILKLVKVHCQTSQ